MVLFFLMGREKVLLTIIVFSISAMMIFSILPAMADPRGPEGNKWECGGESPKGPWRHVFTNSNPLLEVKDKNENFWVCTNSFAGGPHLIVVDDRKRA